MRAFLLDTDRLVRGAPWAIQADQTGRMLTRLAAIGCVFGILYGAVMGAYGGFGSDRWLQIVYSGVKAPLLLLATFCLTLPSYFILNTLLGLRDDFQDVLRALATTQAGLTVCLASLAPFTALWYISWGDYSAAILFNLAMFGTASLISQQLLRRYYRRLIQRNRRHRLLLRVWIVLYGVVGIQMGWILRPFIGSPGAPPQFLRSETWGNPYVILARAIWRLLGG